LFLLIVLEHFGGTNSDKSAFGNVAFVVGRLFSIVSRPSANIYHVVVAGVITVAETSVMRYRAVGAYFPTVDVVVVVIAVTTAQPAIIRKVGAGDDLVIRFVAGR
jgi:hypothetical protein